MEYSLLIQPWCFPAYTINEPSVKNLEVNGRSAKGRETEVPGSEEDVAQSLERLALIVVAEIVVIGAGSQCGEQQMKGHLRCNGRGTRRPSDGNEAASR